MIESGCIIKFKKAANNVAEFCYNKGITGVIVGHSDNKNIIEIGGLTTIFADDNDVEIVASKSDITWVNYGI
jgi:hypothetical protein